jgi:hypothetical protein
VHSTQPLQQQQVQVHNTQLLQQQQQQFAEHLSAPELVMPPVDSAVMDQAMLALRSRPCLPVTPYDSANLVINERPLVCGRCSRYVCTVSCPYR